MEHFTVGYWNTRAIGEPVRLMLEHCVGTNWTDKRYQVGAPPSYDKSEWSDVKEHLNLPFIEINPKASVPVLLLDNGTMLNESMAISVYLDSVFPDNNLTGLDPIERAVIAIAQLDMDFNGLQAVA